MAGQSMRDIKRRIASVKNMQKVTKAMEMVAAAKLRRSQNQVVAGRPFANKLREVLVRLVSATRGQGGGGLSHPLLMQRDARRVLYVVIAGDRGLAGGYNANVLRLFNQLCKRESREVGVVAIGRKTRDFLKKIGVAPVAEYVQIGDEIDLQLARGIAGMLIEQFTSGAFDEVHLVYSEFISAMSQRPKVEKLLPIAKFEGLSEEASTGSNVEYLYEPSPETVLGILLPRYVETEVYRALMEAKASELGARMTAMRNATDNAGEMIEALTLSFNRARQASITKEISEIVGGAEALAAAD